MSMAPGTRLGPYEVVEPIGAGGMGEVYRATDTNLKRDVALKVLPESLVADANRLARLQREAEVLASLNHANVAQVYGLERAGSVTAIVMELVEGPTLADRLAQGALPPNEALSAALQIAAGLEAAHEHGIVHRDLKPANIKLKADGTVKVLDFGIAKALETGATGGTRPPALTTPATEIGTVLGTAAYMSPEQARGKPVDKRADIWAFGCVLYEMLTGQAAFLGDDVTTTLARVLERDPDMRPLPAGLAPAVRRTLELCLQKDVKKRLHDIGDVRLALEGELAGLNAHTAAATPPLWRRALPAAATLVIGALLAAGYMASRTPSAPPPATAPALTVTRFVITPPATAPLASLGGSDLVLSPDGKRLAYFGQNPQTGSVALYVRDLDGLEARLLPGTEITGPGSMSPFFSPDGKWIGFLSPQRGILRVAVDGGPPLKILDDPQAFVGASWAADDTLILSRDRSLVRVSAGGGTAEPTTPEPEDDAAPLITGPVLLPGERAVLFAAVDYSTERVGVLDLDTGEQKTLIEDGQSPTYAATGHIVFARGSTLMAAPFDAAALVVTGEPVALIQGVRHPGALTAADYSLSANGTLAYVPGGESAAAGAAVVWVDRRGAVVARAVSDLVQNPRDPRLSPDGERLVLTTGELNDGDLWSYDLRGRPPIRLAVTGDNRNAVWSSDGREIAFRMGAGASSIVYTLAADGSVLAPQPLRPQNVVGAPAAWSAADELLLFVPGNDPDIAAIPVAGADPLRDVIATEYDEYDAALSPNGRWLAYVSNRSGQLEIWVQRYPDGVPVRVSPNGGYEPRWSADGQELFYLQGTAMMAVAVATDGEFSFTPPVPLFAGRYFAFAGGAAVSYDVARDGRFLMIEPQGSGADAATPSSIVVVQNWLEELKQRVPTGR